MRSITPFNDNWVFHSGFRASLLRAFAEGRSVRLPHNAVDLPLNYFDDSVYQRKFCYQRLLHWDAQPEGTEAHLIFDGAMADGEVHLNGSRIQSHRDGYTPFEARLTDGLVHGENLITVTIDGRENPDIPPFGGHIDYLTYAGIYRDVWLRLTGPAWIGDLKVETPDPLAERKRARIRCWLEGNGFLGGRLRAILADRHGKEIAHVDAAITENPTGVEIGELSGIGLWDIDRPELYSIKVSLEAESGHDHKSAVFGFRSAEFTPEGFLLNGRKLKIRGLNRHQSFPYVGYAMGRRSQERDAEILKSELNCNLVRTSHYPQSPWFLDHCDRTGLLVFEEIPGWQHIGDEQWKRESLRNVERMIRRDWNHPSIVLWGVRINESADDRLFYQATNEVARRLDPTRQTAGVRKIANSELLEDVYTMNDFVIGSEELPGANHHRIALRAPSEVTGLPHKAPYLVCEFNGHMFPTKSFDGEQRQAEHVLRFLQVLNAAYGDPNIAGCIGWCMFDYNTHKEFGAGDRVCHHGVLDMFRVPKFAASVYASQGSLDSGAVLTPVTYWSLGERSIGGVLPLIVLTNCDEVELQLGFGPAQRFLPDRASFPNLPHAPVVIRHGDFTAGDFGMWGRSWEDMRLTGFSGGRTVAETRMAASPIPASLELRADSRALLAGVKDETRVVVRALDQCDSVMPFLTDPVQVMVQGAAELIGPHRIALRGGSAAFWIESNGSVGSVELRVETPRFAPASLTLAAVKALVPDLASPVISKTAPLPPVAENED